MIEKPPLGIIPKKDWDQRRINDILDAMYRFSEAKQPIPIEWVAELEDLIGEMK